MLAVWTTDAVPLADTVESYPSGWPIHVAWARVRVYPLGDTLVMIAEAPTVWPDEPHKPYSWVSVSGGLPRWAAQWYRALQRDREQVPRPQDVVFVAHHWREGYQAEAFNEGRFPHARRQPDGGWVFGPVLWSHRKRGYIEAMIGGRFR